MRAQRNPLILALLLLAVAVASGCRSTNTVFPENPEAHRLYAELERAGSSYYFNVRGGVKSRVLGLQPEDLMRATLSAVQARWGEIDQLDIASEVVAYLSRHGLRVLADRIDETLRQNAGSIPEDGINAALEAGAVKQGLVDAFHEVQEE